MGVTHVHLERQESALECASRNSTNNIYREQLKSRVRGYDPDSWAISVARDIRREGRQEEGVKRC